MIIIPDFRVSDAPPPPPPLPTNTHTCLLLLSLPHIITSTCCTPVAEASGVVVEGGEVKDTPDMCVCARACQCMRTSLCLSVCFLGSGLCVWGLRFTVLRVEFRNTPQPHSGDARLQCTCMQSSISESLAALQYPGHSERVLHHIRRV